MNSMDKRVGLMADTHFHLPKTDDVPSHSESTFGVTGHKIRRHRGGLASLRHQNQNQKHHNGTSATEQDGNSLPCSDQQLSTTSAVNTSYDVTKSPSLSRRSYPILASTNRDESHNVRQNDGFSFANDLKMDEDLDRLSPFDYVPMDLYGTSNSNKTTQGDGNESRDGESRHINHKGDTDDKRDENNSNNISDNDSDNNNNSNNNNNRNNECVTQEQPDVNCHKVVLDKSKTSKSSKGHQDYQSNTINQRRLALLQNLTPVSISPCRFTHSSTIDSQHQSLSCWVKSRRPEIRYPYTIVTPMLDFQRGNGTSSAGIVRGGSLGSENRPLIPQVVNDKGDIPTSTQTLISHHNDNERPTQSKFRFHSTTPRRHYASVMVRNGCCTASKNEHSKTAFRNVTATGKDSLQENLVFPINSLSSTTAVRSSSGSASRNALVPSTYTNASLHTDVISYITSHPVDHVVTKIMKRHHRQLKENWLQVSDRNERLNKIIAGSCAVDMINIKSADKINFHWRKSSIDFGKVSDSAFLKYYRFNKSAGANKKTLNGNNLHISKNKEIENGKTVSDGRNVGEVMETKLFDRGTESNKENSKQYDKNTKTYQGDNNIELNVNSQSESKNGTVVESAGLTKRKDSEIINYSNISIQKCIDHDNDNNNDNTMENSNGLHCQYQTAENHSLDGASVALNLGDGSLCSLNEDKLIGGYNFVLNTGVDDSIGTKEMCGELCDFDNDIEKDEIGKRSFVQTENRTQEYSCTKCGNDCPGKMNNFSKNIGCVACRDTKLEKQIQKDSLFIGDNYTIKTGDNETLGKSVNMCVPGYEEIYKDDTFGNGARIKHDFNKEIIGVDESPKIMTIGVGDSRGSGSSGGSGDVPSGGNGNIRDVDGVGDDGGVGDSGDINIKSMANYHTCYNMTTNVANNNESIKYTMTSDKANVEDGSKDDNFDNKPSKIIVDGKDTRGNLKSSKSVDNSSIVNHSNNDNKTIVKFPLDSTKSDKKVSEWIVFRDYKTTRRGGYGDTYNVWTQDNETTPISVDVISLNKTKSSEDNHSLDSNIKSTTPLQHKTDKLGKENEMTKFYHYPGIIIDHDRSTSLSKTSSNEIINNASLLPGVGREKTGFSSYRGLLDGDRNNKSDKQNDNIIHLHNNNNNDNNRNNNNTVVATPPHQNKQFNLPQNANGSTSQILWRFSELENLRYRKGYHSPKRFLPNRSGPKISRNINHCNLWRPSSRDASGRILQWKQEIINPVSRSHNVNKAPNHADPQRGSQIHERITKNTNHNQNVINVPANGRIPIFRIGSAGINSSNSNSFLGNGPSSFPHNRPRPLSRDSVPVTPTSYSARTLTHQPQQITPKLFRTTSVTRIDVAEMVNELDSSNARTLNLVADRNRSSYDNVYKMDEKSEDILDYFWSYQGMGRQMLRMKLAEPKDDIAFSGSSGIAKNGDDQGTQSIKLDQEQGIAQLKHALPPFEICAKPPKLIGLEYTEDGGTDVDGDDDQGLQNEKKKVHLVVKLPDLF